MSRQQLDKEWGYSGLPARTQRIADAYWQTAHEQHVDQIAMLRDALSVAVERAEQSERGENPPDDFDEWLKQSKVALAATETGRSESAAAAVWCGHNGGTK